jgi:aspartyl-tRNA(Asn)/glutamyl-tRNA(Gln) amidotransferase subunit A
MSETTLLCDMSAIDMLDAFASKALSPVDVMLSVVARIEQNEPTLKATYLFRPEQALEQAKRSEQRWLAGQAQGILDGVPVTIKENLATRGDPLPMGTKAVIASVATQDAPPSARLREAGAIMVSKTTMPDFGMLSSGKSSFHPTACNPWDTSKTPGGSSAGAGSAAAAGYGPLHVGTDIGGSVRLPAGWCGVFGLKPSLGRIPIDPPYTGRVAGPMTQRVSDAALMMQVLAQLDERDSMSLPFASIDWLSIKQPAEQFVQVLKGLKIGLLLNPGCGMPVDARVTDCITKAAKIFELAGAHVQPMNPFMTEDLLQDLDAFWRMRSYTDLQLLPQAQRSQVLPFIAQWTQAAAQFTAPRMYAASQANYLTRIKTVQACNEFDFVICAVAPVIAFDAHNASPRNLPHAALEHIGFTVPFNMSEQPAASINCGYIDNENGKPMPVGLQIVGKRFDDLGVLKIARAFEALREPQRTIGKQMSERSH